MTKRVGMRELARDLKLLEEYDYVDIEDKKTVDLFVETLQKDTLTHKQMYKKHKEKVSTVDENIKSSFVVALNRCRDISNR